MKLRECMSPWYELNISNDHQIQCCCYLKKPTYIWKDFQTSLDFEKVWNGEGMQKVRTTVLSNNGIETTCDNCLFLELYNTNWQSQVSNDVNIIQRKNWETAIKYFNEGKTIIDTVPIRYYFKFGLACNLQCIMCCQQTERKINKESLPSKKILELKEYLLPANEFSIMGGEPFIIPEAIQFIDAITADADFQDNKISIFTNGTMLHKYLDKLRNIKRVGITISLDSIGDYYEHIRVGSTWSAIEKNIDLYKELVEKERLTWTLHIAAIVMKSTIPKIVEFVDWCISRDAPVHFVPLSSTITTGTEEEDIYKNPELLKNIPDWENKLDIAINKVEAMNWDSTLRIIKNQLKELTNGNKG